MLHETLKNKSAHIPEGVKKIYEAVIKEGRSLVVNDLTLDSPLVPNGTLYVDPATSKLKVKQEGSFRPLEQLNVFEMNSLTDIVMAQNAIDGDRLRTRSVTSGRIAYETITGTEISNHSVPGSKIIFNTIENGHIMKDSIDDTQLQTDSVSSDAIQNSSVLAEHIAHDAIKEYHIASGNIHNYHLQADSITSDKIGNVAVRTEHIYTDAIRAAHIADSQIQTTHIIDNAISNSKLQANSVTAPKLASNAVTNEKILNYAVTAHKIADLSVGYSKLETVVRNRIYSSLNVVNGTGTLTTLNATSRVTTKYLTASTSATVGTLAVTSNATVNGKMHVKGDVTTDARIFRVAYNDIAEAYIPGEKLEPGDVVEIAEDGKVYKSTFGSTAVVGVYSDCFGDCYGANIEELETGKKVPIGMIGQVPVKVIGPIAIGQYIVAGDDGIAYPVVNLGTHRPVGKAIRSNDKEGIHRVLCLIFPS